MKKFATAFDTFVKYFLVILVGIISVLGFYQVVTRYLFNNASTWSEEAIRFLFVWASCVGGAIGIKEHIHIGIDAVVNFLPVAGRKAISALVLLVLCIFGVFLTKFGLDLMIRTATQVSPALRLPMSYVYAAIPVLGILTIYYSILELVHTLRAEKEK